MDGGHRYQQVHRRGEQGQHEIHRQPRFRPAHPQHPIPHHCEGVSERRWFDDRFVGDPQFDKWCAREIRLDQRSELGSRLVEKPCILPWPFAIRQRPRRPRRIRRSAHLGRRAHRRAARGERGGRPRRASRDGRGGDGRGQRLDAPAPPLELQRQRQQRRPRRSKRQLGGIVQMGRQQHRA